MGPNIILGLGPSITYYLMGLGPIRMGTIIGPRGPIIGVGPIVKAQLYFINLSFGDIFKTSILSSGGPAGLTLIGPRAY